MTNDTGEFSKTIDALLAPFVRAAESKEFVEALAQARRDHPRMEFGIWHIYRETPRAKWHHARVVERWSTKTKPRKTIDDEFSDFELDD